MRTDVGLITLHAGVHVPEYVSMSHAARRTLLSFLVASASTNLPGSCCLGLTLPMVNNGDFGVGVAISGRLPSGLRERSASSRWYLYSGASQRAARALGISALVSLLKIGLAAHF